MTRMKVIAGIAARDYLSLITAELVKGEHGKWTIVFRYPEAGCTISTILCRHASSATAASRILRRANFDAPGALALATLRTRPGTTRWWR